MPWCERLVDWHPQLPVGRRLVNALEARRQGAQEFLHFASSSLVGQH